MNTERMDQSSSALQRVQDPSETRSLPGHLWESSERACSFTHGTLRPRGAGRLGNSGQSQDRRPGSWPLQKGWLPAPPDLPSPALGSGGGLPRRAGLPPPASGVGGVGWKSLSRALAVVLRPCLGPGGCSPTQAAEAERGFCCPREPACWQFTAGWDLRGWARLAQWSLVSLNTNSAAFHSSQGPGQYFLPRSPAPWPLPAPRPSRRPSNAQ